MSVGCPIAVHLRRAQINGEQVDPLATIVHRDDAYRVGKGLTVRLKELIPRQQFKVPIQAAIGARVVASESISGAGRLLTAVPVMSCDGVQYAISAKRACRRAVRPSR